MATILSHLELDVLRKLISGESVFVSSQQRLRLELAGVIREQAQGIVVTADGRRLASQKPEAPAPGSMPAASVGLDKRGRRLPNQRRSIL
jgi:hypothetical protein